MLAISITNLYLARRLIRIRRGSDLHQMSTTVMKIVTLLKVCLKPIQPINTPSPSSRDDIRAESTNPSKMKQYSLGVLRGSRVDLGDHLGRARPHNVGRLEGRQLVRRRRERRRFH